MEELLVGSVIVLALYFLPSIIAASRKKKNTGAIFVVNFFLGWTLIGWVVALAWSVTHEEKIPVQKSTEEVSETKEKKHSIDPKLGLLLIVFSSAVVIVLARTTGFKPSDSQSTASPPSDIGKYAYNATNGVYRGRIIEFKACSSEPNLNCYVVEHPDFSKPMEAPVVNVVVKDQPPI